MNDKQVILDYLDKFEEKLRAHLLKIATERGLLDGKLLESSDISDYWKSVEADYMADAVPQVAAYPTVSVAWALYLDMAVAHLWDGDWEKHRTMAYKDFYGSDGFDNMDDHIVNDILGMPLGSAEAKALISAVQTLAQATVDMIRREQIQPQSKMAFFAFSRACTSMFMIGAAMQLKQLGYRFEKM